MVVVLRRSWTARRLQPKRERYQTDACASACAETCAETCADRWRTPAIRGALPLRYGMKERPITSWIVDPGCSRVLGRGVSLTTRPLNRGRTRVCVSVTWKPACCSRARAFCSSSPTTFGTGTRPFWLVEAVLAGVVVEEAMVLLGVVVEAISGATLVIGGSVVSGPLMVGSAAACVVCVVAPLPPPDTDLITIEATARVSSAVNSRPAATSRAVRPRRG